MSADLIVFLGCGVYPVLAGVVAYVANYAASRTLPAPPPEPDRDILLALDLEFPAALALPAETP